METRVLLEIVGVGLDRDLGSGCESLPFGKRSRMERSVELKPLRYHSELGSGRHMVDRGAGDLCYRRAESEHGSVQERASGEWQAVRSEQ